MKIIITESQIENIIQKFLDRAQKEYEGKICRFKFSGEDSFQKDTYLIWTYVSEDWRDGYENDSMDFWNEVYYINGNLKNSLNTFFSGKKFSIVPVVKNCEKL